MIEHWVEREGKVPTPQEMIGRINSIRDRERLCALSVFIQIPGKVKQRGGDTCRNFVFLRRCQFLWPSRYRDRQIHKPQVWRKWGEKVAFFCLLQAGERNFLSSYSPNLGFVDLPITVHGWKRYLFRRALRNSREEGGGSDPALAGYFHQQLRWMHMHEAPESFWSD